MYLLETVTEQSASEEAKKIFDWFADKGFGTPHFIKKSSISPELAQTSIDQITYFSTHENLSFPLLASIRYAIAANVCYDFCVGLNGDMLKNMGMTTEDLEAVANTQHGTPLEEHEEALLKFVAKRVLSPADGATEEEVVALRKLGWTDKDIFDATFHGFSVLMPSMIEQSLSDQKSNFR